MNYSVFLFGETKPKVWTDRKAGCGARPPISPSPPDKNTEHLRSVFLICCGFIE
jgi:hypothetical protein